ncbi:DUF2165 family protein [Pseudomonas sp. GM55]|uniref:DUF2165 family protein n=1 Tax=Pseudomonas sp. GM55 TaxID=1144333 RepID=UPI0002709FD1|nr:DUF2165 domain-containing protein [Pseudomonas sp. GM55]EJM69094.1 putative small integral membrane protein [Pseudomonas sp. GM55]
MNSFNTNQTIRISKVTILLFVSFFGLLTTYNNLTDYSTNYEYLSHILSMDTTPNLHKHSYRAITSPLLHHRIFWLIITLEIMFTLFCILGTYYLYKNISASKEAFHESKKFAVIGLLIGLFIYYVCFQAIGIEWFNMDESAKWNYRDWGRQAVDFILLSLIYIALRIES